MPWQLFIDAGGTFTDCLALSPEGQTKRLKVLSHSALRGSAITRLSDFRMQITQQWSFVTDILGGYPLLQLPDHRPIGQIVATDLQAGWIEVDQPLPPTEAFPFDWLLNSPEEAPAFAARLLTETPLHEALPKLKLRLGSTRGTNALLERKGASVVWLTTAGLEDLLRIGTQQRPDLFALNVQRPAPLYQQVIPVQERLTADGQVQIPLQPRDIQRIVEEVQQSGCESVAIAMLHAYRNPIHEEQLAAALAAVGIPHISCSEALAPVLRLLPRAETAVVNAYLSPLIDQYLQNIQTAIPHGQIQVMTSAGGLQGADHFFPKDSLLSGPAAGVVGAASIAEACGYSQLLTLDMGGTSSDVARYAGSIDYVYETHIGDAHLLAAAVAIHTVAAGGGSCCTFDGHQLQIGPESAGASPGPACYGAGGPLTLTDVNLLRHRLDPSTISIPLNRKAAQQALQSIIEQSNLSAEALLAGFSQIANEKMAAAIREISVQQGYDPQTYALLAFGGAGGQHACAVADLLHIREVLIPREAGILSAVGMQQAQLERMATQEVLQPWATVAGQVPDWVQHLIGQARQQLAIEGVQETDIAAPQAWLSLRLRGQDQSLEIPLTEQEMVSTQFEAAYRRVYGHWMPDQVLELASIRVMLRERAAAPTRIERPTTFTLASPDRLVGPYPVYDWDKLDTGDEITGPALIVSSLGTTFVEAGWLGYMDTALNLHMQRHAESRLSNQKEQAKAIQLALFSRRFQGIAEEMGALLQRSSFSVNVKERLDFSCALLDQEGFLVANAPHIPVHLGSLGVCVRAVNSALTLGPGDVAITNHPAYGGSHLPDVTLIAPVYDGEQVLLGYVANRAHHAEIGGKRPGSMPPDARHLGEEGVVIPPMKLVDGGILQWAAIQDLLTTGPYPTRNVAENLADLQAGLASIHIGIQRLQELSQQVGSSEVHAYQSHILHHADARLQATLASWPSGQYPATEFLDDGSRLQVCWHIHDSRIHLDFSGTSGVHPGNLNANAAIVNSAVVYVLRLIVDTPIPLNEGLMRRVDITLPAGMLNPPFSADPTLCPAVVGGNVETSQRLVDTLLKALSLVACSQGTMNNLLFGHDGFGYYETIAGGTGAGPGFDGASGVHQHMTNTRMTDPEVMELRYPVQVMEFGLRKGSAGAGMHPGGDGIIRRLRFTQPVDLTVLTQHRASGPYGLAGGSDGSPGQQHIIRASGAVEPLAGIDQAQLHAGDEIEIQTPGGGGYGMPL